MGRAPESCHAIKYLQEASTCFDTFRNGVPMASHRGKKRRRVSSTGHHDVRWDFQCDLHGHTVASALQKVENDLTTFRRQKPGAIVHVITGKGENSPGGISRLKPAIEKSLSVTLAPLIADVWIDDDDGGFMVCLK
jgi:DNA-nicking Smr family endonuclease